MRWFGDTDLRIGRIAGRFRGDPALDKLAYSLSEAANHSILWHAINLADLSIGTWRRDGPRCRRAVRRSIIQGVEQALINGPVKTVVKRQRPTDDVAHPHRLRVPVTSSFPSGHATAGSCAAELLAHDLGHRRAWWALAGVIGWSRIHVGVHHPSDVAAGWVIGATAARVAGVLWPAPRSTVVRKGPQLAPVPDTDVVRLPGSHRRPKH